MTRSAARRTGPSAPVSPTVLALDMLAPSIARAAAAPLPPRAQWTPAMIELHAERVCIATEGGSRDALAVADLDLRVALRRGEVEGPALAPAGEGVDGSAVSTDAPAE